MRSSPNFEVLKVPRGFIKCLEVFLAIFAFSCATGYTGYVTVSQKFDGTSSILKESFGYPFETPLSFTLYYNKTDMRHVNYPIDERSSTEFFVVIGVFCFLYSLGVLVYLIFKDDEAQTSPSNNLLSFPVIDLCFGVFWALFWFFSSCAIATAVSRLKTDTDIQAKIHNQVYCTNGITCHITGAKYGTLTAAILLGFLNVFVWGGDLWFLYKETHWHSSRHNQPATMGGQHQSTPAAAAI